MLILDTAVLKNALALHNQGFTSSPEIIPSRAILSEGKHSSFLSCEVNRCQQHISG